MFLPLLFLNLLQFTLTHDQLIFTNRLGITKISIENYLMNNLSITLEGKTSQKTILIICNQQPEIVSIDTLYNDIKYGCIADWNSFDDQNNLQQLYLKIYNGTITQNYLPINTKISNGSNIFIGTFSEKRDNFIIKIEQFSKNIQLNCKQNETSLSDYCLCDLGNFGQQCQYNSQDITQQRYLQQNQFYHLIIDHQANLDFIIKFNQVGYLSYQCFISQPYLFRQHISFVNQLTISYQELNNCFSQYDIYQKMNNYIIFQIHQETNLYITTSNKIEDTQIIIIITVTTILGVICCFGFCAFKCCYLKIKKTKIQKKQSQTNQQQLITLVNSFENNSQYLPPMDYKKAKSRYPEINTQNQCCICLCEFLENELVSITYCMHIMHKNCFDQWLLNHQFCPLCRAQQDYTKIKKKIEEDRLATFQISSVQQNTEIYSENRIQKKNGHKRNSQIALQQYYNYQ